MKITNRDIIKLRNNFGTSFYIFDNEQFISNFLNFRKTFCDLYPKTEVTDACKSNYMPVLAIYNYMKGQK